MTPKQLYKEIIRLYYVGMEEEAIQVIQEYSENLCDEQKQLCCFNLPSNTSLEIDGYIFSAKLPNNIQ